MTRIPKYCISTSGLLFAPQASGAFTELRPADPIQFCVIYPMLRSLKILSIYQPSLVRLQGIVYF